MSPQVAVIVYSPAIADFVTETSPVVSSIVTPDPEMLQVTVLSFVTSLPSVSFITAVHVTVTGVVVVGFVTSGDPIVTSIVPIGAVYFLTVILATDDGKDQLFFTSYTNNN